MLVAIDGTRSRRARGSNVREFHSRYVGAKLYYHGPDRWITGADLWDSVQSALRFILWNRKSLGNQEAVDLIGHSRGGMGVIVVAQKLAQLREGPVPVRFMGLYDAVDRTPTVLFGVIPANVGHVRHAIRDPLAGSRPMFGNTGVMRAPGIDYRLETFHGTHAAVGGDPWRGDHPSQLNEADDVVAAGLVQQWMREQAQACGVPVH